jgi:phosphopantothenoylcysteine synthetase/decarboxylase
VSSDGTTRLPLPTHPRLLVGATGSIAAQRLPAYLDALRGAFDGTFTVVMTHTASQFVSAPVLRLHAERVVHGDRPDDWDTDRPSRLVCDHDALVVLPATAHTLAMAATGAAPNRVTTIVLAAPYPSVFVPHMGTPMWEASAVRRNVAQLREDGHRVLDPVMRVDRDVVTGAEHTHPAVPEPADLVHRLTEIYRCGS